MDSTEAGPGPGSAASRADGRTLLQIRFGHLCKLCPAVVKQSFCDHQVSCRTLLCERGLLQRADGSARWSQDKTSVLAAVYGPRTTLGRKEDSEQAVVEVVFKPKSGMYRYNAPGVVHVAAAIPFMCSCVHSQALPTPSVCLKTAGVMYNACIADLI